MIISGLSVNTGHRETPGPAGEPRAVCLVSVGIKYFVSFSQKMTSHGTSQVNYHKNYNGLNMSVPRGQL